MAIVDHLCCVRWSGRVPDTRLTCASSGLRTRHYVATDGLYHGVEYLYVVRPHVAYVMFMKTVKCPSLFSLVINITKFFKSTFNNFIHLQKIHICSRYR